ncbi:MAG: hypothetical protein ACXWCT_11105 [Flavitalea sp.]
MNKRIFYLLFFIAALGEIAIAQNPAPPPPRMQQQRRIVSPEIDSESKVTFRFNAPNASEVSVSGEWQKFGETQKMTKGDSGIWTITSGPLKPEFYGYIL